MKKWWQRTRRAPPADVSDGAENLLIISDIHLGEDILIDGPPQLGGYIRALNLALTQFISAHAGTPKGPRWHLVINGDMFDFVKVAGGPTQDPRGVPMRNTPENVVVKLQHILEVHRPLFREMARFLRTGHKVTIIEGNHDAEFYFDDVREALRQELVRLAQQNLDKGVSAQAVEAGVRERLGFRSWFLASLGNYHIEHGHQYDEFCSFEYPLAPDDAGRGRTLATPLSHRPMPFFSELLGDFSTHGIAHWSFADFMAFFVKLGGRGLWTLMRLYVSVGFGLLRLAGGKRRTQMQALAAEYAVQLLALSQSSAYDLSTIHALDQLKAPPAEYSLWKMVHIFYLDRIALFFWGALMALAALASGRPFWGCVALTTMALGILVLARLAKHNPVLLLRDAAAKIARITGAPYVVFGHSHAPEMRSLGPGHYINSGSWVTRELLRGDAGVGMTYVEIAEGVAQLKRWRGPEQPAEVLTVARHDANA